MPLNNYYECDYCGTTNDDSNEQCTKCGKYKHEDAEEFAKYKDSVEEALANQN